MNNYKPSNLLIGNKSERTGHIGDLVRKVTENWFMEEYRPRQKWCNTVVKDLKKTSALVHPKMVSVGEHSERTY
jgi:hypothetical protein